MKKAMIAAVAALSVSQVHAFLPVSTLNAETVIAWLSTAGQAITRAIESAQTVKKVDAMAKGNNQVSDAMEKNAQSTKSVVEGVAGWKAQNQMRRDMAEVEYNLQLPSDTCAAMASRTGISSAEVRAREAVAPAQKRTTRGLIEESSPTVSMGKIYAESNQKFCTPTDRSRGICSDKAKPGYERFEGADQDAMYLYQSMDGDDTYGGEPQNEAVDLYIRRIVAQMPPGLLADKQWDKTKDGKAYIEMVRRYRAYMSMAAYSLNMVRVARLAKSYQK